MQDLKWLETFVSVVELGGFRAAAARLNTTQPSVSARIDQLERQLGVTLFSRGSRRRELTREGLVVLDYARRMLELQQELQQVVRQPSAIRGVLRIGVAETLVHSLMPRLLESIGASYPQVVLDLMVDTTNILSDQLRQGEIDISMQVGPVADPRAVNRRLCHFPLGWVASPALPLRQGPLLLRELTRWPVISFSHNSPLAAEIQRALAASGTPDVRLWGSASLTLMVHMAQDGAGCCILPLAVLRREIAAGLLRVLEVTDVVLPRNAFHVSYLRRADNFLAAMVAERAAAIGEELERAAQGDQDS